jgi:hypothetical protein
VLQRSVEFKLAFPRRGRRVNLVSAARLPDEREQAAADYHAYGMHAGTAFAVA